MLKTLQTTRIKVRILLSALLTIFLLSPLSAQDHLYTCQGKAVNAFDIQKVGIMDFYNNGHQLKICDRIYETTLIDSISFKAPAFVGQILGQKAQTSKQKRVAVLDLTLANEQEEASQRNVYSAEYMLEVAGIPSFTTVSLKEALTCSDMIILSSEVKNKTFTPTQLDSLVNWVKEGGVIVSPAVTAKSTQSNGERVSNLFGISSSVQAKDRYRLLWNEAFYNDKELEYFDQSEERVMSLGRGKKLEGESIKTFAFTLSDNQADVLARFDAGENAVVRHRLGKGTVYTFGILWRDVIQRSQLNKDFEAQRQGSNFFEPSADIVPFFLRSTFAKHNPVAVWKHTIPDTYESILIPTHDSDSRTAYDSMFYLSDYERDLGLNAHYFLTTHYFRDKGYMSAFFDEKGIENAKKLLANGHTVGSHSICHFPDFNNTDRFPLTVVTIEEYEQTAHHQDGVTTGGSTWAEVVLSKQIIENTLHNHVRSFRSGHLCMNKNIPVAEQMGGYEFSSCYSACEILSEFPFRERIGNDWAGDYNGALVMPLQISDDVSDNPVNADNWEEAVTMWKEIIDKLQGNYAPTVLLIHPNRKWKMLVEQLLISKLDRSRVGLYNFEDWGDYWNRRRELDFDYGYDAEHSLLEIYLNGNTPSETLRHQAFAVDLQEGASRPEQIRLISAEGEVIATGICKSLSPTRFLITF